MSDMHIVDSSEIKFAQNDQTEDWVRNRKRRQKNKTKEGSSSTLFAGGEDDHMRITKVNLKEIDNSHLKMRENSNMNREEHTMQDLKIIDNTQENTQYQSIDSQGPMLRSRKKVGRLVPVETLKQGHNEDDDSPAKRQRKKKLRNDHNSPTKKMHQMPKSSMRINDIKAFEATQFVKMHVPPHKKINTLLKRHRQGTLWFYPRYDMFLMEQMHFIMSSKRKTCHLTSNYHMGVRKQPVDQGHQKYVGTAVANYSGSEWSFYETKQDNQKQLIATICYDSQMRCSEAPRHLEAYILSPFYQYSDLDGSSTKQNLQKLALINDNLENRRIFKLVNRKPEWNPITEQYHMNFHGKAKESSVKNMIMVNALNPGQQILLIAKSSQNTYVMDFEFPLSPRLAMAIATTSFDFKWASE